MLRHSFASHLAMRGAPLKVIQELLGHATIQMTMRYAHLAPEIARDEVKLLDQTSSAWSGSRMAADKRKRTGIETVRDDADNLMLCATLQGSRRLR